MVQLCPRLPLCPVKIANLSNLAVNSGDFLQYSHFIKLRLLAGWVWWEEVKSLRPGMYICISAVFWKKGGGTKGEGAQKGRGGGTNMALRPGTTILLRAGSHNILIMTWSLFQAASYADSGKGGEPRGGADFPRSNFLSIFSHEI